jgi:hypothetical protein
MEHAGPQPSRATIFVLSPASLIGRRAELLLRPQAAFDLAVRLRTGGAVSLGDVFTFLSGLYFRGKLAYAEAFGRAPAGLQAALVITPSRGLLPAYHPASLDLLHEFRSVAIDLAETRYREPLSASTTVLATALSQDDRVILLGSIATGKYLDVLGLHLGERLLFPGAFVGRGDMSRGGLMLRCVDEGRELDYVAIAGTVRTGSRPPRLEPRRWPPISAR